MHSRFRWKWFNQPILELRMHSAQLRLRLRLRLRLQQLLTSSTLKI
jgi:hypothetical protein